MEEDKWERYERERKIIQPETQTQLELLRDAFRLDTVDETVKLLLQTREFTVQVAAMVERLQGIWNLSEPLEVVTLLVRQALDREERESSLLSLLEELEVSGVTDDPVTYLTDLVHRDRAQRGQLEQLVEYEHLPYSRLVGIETVKARRERWRRAIWTIMMHNRACAHAEERWYINVWAVAALAGGSPLAVARYLEERSAELQRHHQVYEIHPNRNQKACSIVDMLSIAEDPIPAGGEALWTQIDEQP